MKFWKAFDGLFIILVMYGCYFTYIHVKPDKT